MISKKRTILCTKYMKVPIVPQPLQPVLFYTLSNSVLKKLFVCIPLIKDVVKISFICLSFFCVKYLSIFLIVKKIKNHFFFIYHFSYVKNQPIILKCKNVKIAYITLILKSISKGNNLLIT